MRSSQHPRTGHVIYNLSLDMGGFKVYEDPEGFTCCVGTGMENHAKYGGSIYYHRGMNCTLHSTLPRN
ncbi:MAG: glycoside hydrolase family 127 protein [Bacteroidales bacterium]